MVQADSSLGGASRNTHASATLAQRAICIAKAAPNAASEAGSSSPSPLAVPNTAREFTRGLRALRFGCPDKPSKCDSEISPPAPATAEAIKYVQSIPTSSYKDVFKSDLDAGIMKEILAVLSAVQQSGDPQDNVAGKTAEEWCLECLKALRTIDRFVVVYTMLPVAVRKGFAAVKGGLTLNDADSTALSHII